MNRDLISFEALFSSAAKQYGYTPYYCSTPSLMPMVQSMPAAVIYPSEVTDKVGITRCRITTEVKFLIIKTGVSYSYEQKMQALSDMRLDILQMVSSLEANVDVVNVTDIAIEVDSTPLMHSDDLQLRTTVTIVSNFTHSTLMEDEE